MAFQRTDRPKVAHLAAQGCLGRATDPFAQVRQAERAVEVRTEDRAAERTG
jgi:hypothetical protein